MGRSQIACTFALLFFISVLNGQSFNNYYLDNYDNEIAGYSNAVYHSKSSTYFLVELDREIDISFYSALHVKKVDENGFLIDERYFVTDFDPYSGHYISGVQVQGDEIVVFVNRNVSFPHVHDVFIIRVKMDLSGTPTSKRFYLDGSDEVFNSVKINEVVPYGNKLLFTGSAFTRGDLNYHADASKLLVGFVNADGSITYNIYQIDDDLVEGLSLLPRPKANEFYLSVRYTDKESEEYEDLPAIFKFQTYENYFYVNWGELYPELRVDASNYTSYNEGIEIPLIESYTSQDVPAFLARNSDIEELTFVPFSRLNGDPVAASVRKFNLPAEIELIDAVKMTGTDNGLAVLFTRKEPYNLWNSESYLMTCPEIYSFFASPKWRNLTAPAYTLAIQARRILIPGKEELAVAGLVNQIDYTLSSNYRASLMKSDDLTFECVPSKSLKKPKYTPIVSENILLKLSYVPIQEEEREMIFDISVPTTTEGLCGPMFTGKEQATTRSNSTEISVYPSPANEQLQVKIPVSDSETRTAVVRNMMGRIVHTESVGMNQSDLTVNTSEFASGIYYFELHSLEGDVEKKRFMVVH